MRLTAVLLLCGVAYASAGAGGDEVCGAGAVGEGGVAGQSLIQADKAAMRVSTSARECSKRFRKYNDTNTLPALDFPLTQAQTMDVLAGTKAVSPRWFGHQQVTNCMPRRWSSFGSSFAWVQEKLLSSQQYWPTHADDSGADQQQFWKEFEEVVAAQQLRRKGELTSTLMSMHPLFDEAEDISASAQRVRADFPTHFPNLQITRFLGQGLKLDDNIFRRPECGQSGTPEFVNGAVALSGIAGWAITQVSPVAFASKWHVGRQRPEEVAMLVSQGELAGASAELEQAVKQMSLSHAAEFTAYTEGSPVHPSWPAMHSAASSLSTWMEVVAEMTAEQREEARLLDYSIAYFRTLAGVHYESDNRAGLALGKGLIEGALPGFLADSFACDAASAVAIREYAENKIAGLNLDWSTWTPPTWVKPTLQTAR